MGEDGTPDYVQEMGEGLKSTHLLLSAGGLYRSEAAG